MYLLGRRDAESHVFFICYFFIQVVNTSNTYLVTVGVEIIAVFFLFYSFALSKKSYFWASSFCAPQEPAPMTEDLLEEQSEVLAKLGTSAEGAHLRARMQSACLLSDMESFKVGQSVKALVSILIYSGMKL